MKLAFGSLFSLNFFLFCFCFFFFFFMCIRNYFAVSCVLFSLCCSLEVSSLCCILCTDRRFVERCLKTRVIPYYKTIPFPTLICFFFLMENVKLIQKFNLSSTFLLHANFSPLWQRVGFAAPNRRKAPQIKHPIGERHLK
jgi:hypothetical protein